VIDELAYFSVTIGTPAEQDEFKTLVRDLVARGRAAGIIMIAATQRPSADIIPTSLRDLFGFRVAFRCTTDSSSDIILSVGWAKEGYSARAIRPEDIGIGWILAEGGIPRRFKAAYLTDRRSARSSPPRCAAAATAAAPHPPPDPARSGGSHFRASPPIRTNHLRDSTAIPVTGGVCPCPLCSSRSRSSFSF
jgi:hypothetical protein